eukprot:s5894_g1.t1
MLTAAALAPGSAATLEALTDPARRPAHPLRAPAPEVLQYRPSEEVLLSAHQVGEALRTSKRGSAAGLSGATVELYKLLLDDAAALESFTFAVNVAARAQAPQVERGAGVEANLGKTRVFNAAGGDAPPGVDVLGPDVWCGHLPPEQRGFVALGVPIGRLTSQTHAAP